MNSTDELRLIAKGRQAVLLRRVAGVVVASALFWRLLPVTGYLLPVSLAAQALAYAGWSTKTGLALRYGWRLAADAFAMTTCAAFAYFMWLSGGVGIPAGLLLLFSLILNSLIVSRGDRWTLVALVGPCFAVIAAAPATAAVQTGAWAEFGTILIVEGVALTLVISTGRWLAGVHVAEQMAREQLVEGRRQAEAATEAKSAFVAMVSHELRTPITAIVAGAEALRRSAADVASRSNADLIADACGMLRVLLNDLLDFSKLEAGRLAVEELPYDLRSAIRDTAVLWRAEARDKGVRLKLVGGHRLPAFVQGDPTRLKQILNNLLSNAMKFTSTGAVTLELRVEPDFMVFAVADTGRGMTSEQLERLFTPFEQMVSSDARLHGGTGLGLAISRDLARLMGGELEVSSRLGEGSRFSLRLPLTASCARPISQGGDEPQPSSAVLRTLVIDDHELNWRALTLVLEAAGASVTTAAEASQALALLADEAFDLVLLDLHLGNVSGLDVARSIRKGAGCNHAVPIIAVTGSAEPEAIAACASAGMDGHVEKPVSPALLFAAIERAMAQRLALMPQASAPQVAELVAL